MRQIGTPFAPHATKVMLLGSGELGKEVVIELQRLGVETIAVDRYPHAPAMQVAHHSITMNMQDSHALLEVIKRERPDYIVPEIEAIATSALVELEAEGFRVVPSANAVDTTMNRERIRNLAADQLGLPVSNYRFVDTKEAYSQALQEIGLPCVVKPVMSSSGKGQSTVRTPEDAWKSWDFAHEDTRGSADRIIVEELIEFDYEITLLTIQHIDGVSFCEPIGHRQEKGDYQESWQPHPMKPETLKKCQEIATQVTNALGGYGLFGVEFFIKSEEVYFSELSPRPHDTGMVTMISQDLSEFELHARAFLGLPIPNIECYGPSASHVISVTGVSNNVRYSGIEQALVQPDTKVRLFGKPSVDGERRMGVALARGTNIENARRFAETVVGKVQYKC
ncbi:MAG: formate-dependent phosphoribosylglycinamide formyltransferase [Gammaproteobacteria bacterium]|nr:formate-dependent phosphoribosylglycinamide formyltransferase [Gammaproteobacteria bacterium]MDE0251799.1 formate-dependent phosphoribosylglycinamide formyltransferase [Gammaproteobacteria bacterium]MDE0403192.1 formate-dependent phosphoribosylglycinamide formyltransferase [Gammaproteobacteria bacterium]